MSMLRVSYILLWYQMDAMQLLIGIPLKYINYFNYLRPSVQMSYWGPKKITDNEIAKNKHLFIYLCAHSNWTQLLPL
jgi:hypothetical protein